MTGKYNMSFYMEENLNIPLKKALSLMSDSIVEKIKYFGAWTMKSPMDAWVYQEIIYETKPDVIIEIGCFHGGSTLYLLFIPPVFFILIDKAIILKK